MSHSAGRQFEVSDGPLESQIALPEERSSAVAAWAVVTLAMLMVLAVIAGGVAVHG